MNLEQRLIILEASPVPAWVVDPEPIKILWANDKALEFWRAADRAELYARDHGVSVTAHTRVRNTLARAQEGPGVTEEWTFYPRGEPISVRLCSSTVKLDDGRLGLLQQA